MKILALDQASRTTGYAIFEDGKLINYGKFTFEDSDFGLRLQKIRNKVKSLIENNSIDELIFEDIQYQKKVSGHYNEVNNVDTFKKLAEVLGIVYELATEMDVPTHAVLAVTWRSELKIPGVERTDAKKNTQKWVDTTFNVKPTQDECDAIGIGEYYWRAIANKPQPFDWS